MAVFWTIQAQRHLRHALAESLARDGGRPAIGTGPWTGVLEATLDHLNELLALTFEGASVVVKDQVIGYRRKKDLFILLVEAFGNDEENVRPVCGQDRHEGEARKGNRGLESLPPAGTETRPGVPQPAAGPAATFDNRTWMSLVYGDAQQFLGVRATVTFEEAALECVRSGFPKILSIGVVINELFERIGHLLYSQGFVDDPGHARFRIRPAQTRSRPRALGDRPVVPGRAAGCQRTGRQRRRTVSRPRRLPALPSGLRSLAASPSRTARMPSQTAVGQPEPTDSRLLPRPKVTDLIPRMLRGCAHGDLHGRNILVGIVRDQAMWPTVFDYEDMSPRNLIGWDFVKLETELKIRAYIDLFGGTAAAKFIQQVQRFEIELSLATEECHRNRSWPEIGDPVTPEDRLQGHPALDPPHGGTATGSQPRPPQRLAGGVLFLAGLLRRLYRPI